MILVDTSVWIDHFRKPIGEIIRRADARDLLTRPFVIGELALGGLRQGAEIGFYLQRMPTILTARHSEVLKLVAVSGAPGSGIGWVDMHLLCAAKLTAECRLWTHDQRLHRVAERLGIAHAPDAVTP